MNIKVSVITQEDIQREINLESQNHSPKTVWNSHGLVSAVLRVYRPNFAIKTDLLKKVRPQIYVPSDLENQQLLDTVHGTEMELPVLLATFGSIRRREISAPDSFNINGNVVHVCQNMVKTENEDWIIKTPKSYAGNRFIDYPNFVAEKWKGLEGRIINLSPNTHHR